MKRFTVHHEATLGWHVRDWNTGENFRLDSFNEAMEFAREKNNQVKRG